MNVYAWSLPYFVSYCNTHGLRMPGLTTIATETIDHLKGHPQTRQASGRAQRLERHWYASVAAGTPDYSVYAAPEYVAELWACWRMYARPYLRRMQLPTSLHGRTLVADLAPVRTIVDLGNGLGLTSAYLSAIFPEARVIATNLPGTAQWAVASALCRENGVQLVADLADIEGPIDVVFASEYFEHFAAPIDHLRQVLQLQPRALLIANTFTARSIGHFHQYRIDDGLVDGRTASWVFNETVRNAGYSLIRTGLWNNRPRYWRRDVPAS